MLRKFYRLVGYITLLSCIVILNTQTSFAAHVQPEQSLDRIVAIVNDTVITESDLSQATSAAKQQLQASRENLPSNEVLHKQVLEQLINRKLQLQLAELAGIQVNDEELTKTISNIANQNHININQLYAKLSSQGINTEEYRKAIREELTIQQIQQQEIGAKITITPQEVNDFMRSKTWLAYNNNEYHLEDILIALPEAPTPKDVHTAKTHAEEIMTKLKNGKSFREVAMAESGDKNALQGGDLGWRKLPEIPSAFAEQLIHLKANDLLGPVLTPNGFHIVKLVGLRNVASNGDKTSLHKQVEQLLYQRKYEEGLQSWITKIRSEAFINMHPES